MPGAKRKRKPSTWERFVKKNGFLYAAAGTAVVTAAASPLIGGVPNVVQRLFRDDRPTITLTDDSATLTDLSLAYPAAVAQPTEAPAGGTKAGVTRTKMVIYNSTGATIRVLDIQAKVRKRSGPLHGTLLAQTSQGGTSEVIGLALWQQPAIARVLTGPTALGDPYFSVQSIELPAGASQVVEITAIPDRHYYEYALAVTYDRDGKQKTAEATDASLKVTGYAPAYDAASEGTPGSYAAIDAARVREIATSPAGD
ncbi:hypothetical protein [Paractinoplanes durhamensis]|uniref:Tat pathway signal sequence domain protein n=1 Tax=Paractinoplanes durhamensis TaxID=113563 RepID=A0ABQ3YV81_9ACTN|nr:hypothetical protein [Actinoplanes durhamensis]GIE01404.1 hypothetical protein Adu01nite_27540 [Actinoplanes durhamensis]